MNATAVDCRELNRNEKLSLIHKLIKKIPPSLLFCFSVYLCSYVNASHDGIINQSICSSFLPCRLSLFIIEFRVTTKQQ